MMWLYSICWYLFRALSFCMWRIEIIGSENIPATGGGILCSNHISAWDPLVLAMSTRRKLHFMAKDELFQIAFLRWLLSSWGMIRVKRGLTDRRAIREVLQHLQSGEMFGIFPEGTRHYDGELHDFFQGTTYFALKAGVPIIPAAIIGDYHKFRSTLRVHIGEPLRPPQNESPEREEMLQWTERLMQTIAMLQEVAR